MVRRWKLLISQEAALLWLPSTYRESSMWLMPGTAGKFRPQLMVDFAEHAGLWGAEHKDMAHWVTHQWVRYIPLGIYRIPFHPRDRFTDRLAGLFLTGNVQIALGYWI